jgi:hypothetical protein
MTTKRFALGVFVPAVALAAPAVAQANEVTKWNAIAQTTVLSQPPVASAPPAAGVFMAMVQGAVYGAVNAIDRHHRPYLVYRRVNASASKEAAVATAAFEVLDELFPAQHTALRTQYDDSLTAIPDGALKQAGIAAGHEAADAVLAEGHDGRLGPIPPLPPVGVGYWQPLLGPSGPLLDPTPWVALARPFLVKSNSQFRTAGPDPLGSAAYADDFNEVKELGAVDSATRTSVQTHTAFFWQSNPAANWNSILRRLADDPAHALGITDSALLFALVDLTAADAIINCWNDKYYWGFWRPLVAIHMADDDGNPATEADPDWVPLFNTGLTDPTFIGAGPLLITPPYPDHPSGAVCFNSSSAHALQAFLGTDELDFFATSSRFPMEQRHFERLSDLVNQVIEARIWAGIHFRNADVQAALVGEQVARWTRLHYFMPLH